ncbi:hypothetical protein MMC20_002332 [Loxospora ochrophaea]|nr:hypothetical protein [Loxospora ochrophaea]
MTQANGYVKAQTGPKNMDGDGSKAIGTSSQELTFQEYLAVRELDFEWAESYDSKDWSRLASILAPTLSINYAKVTNTLSSSLPAASFLAMMSSPLFLGDPLVDSQHMLGAAKYRKVPPSLKGGDEVIMGTHQSRAAHVRWKDESKKEVVAKGHGHGCIEVRWNEGDWEGVFLGVGEGKDMGKGEAGMRGSAEEGSGAVEVVAVETGAAKAVVAEAVGA